MSIISALTAVIELSAAEGSTPGWTARSLEHSGPLPNQCVKSAATTSNGEGQASAHFSLCHPIPGVGLI